MHTDRCEKRAPQFVLVTVCRLPQSPCIHKVQGRLGESDFVLRALLRRCHVAATLEDRRISSNLSVKDCGRILGDLRLGETLVDVNTIAIEQIAHVITKGAERGSTESVVWAALISPAFGI
jgi:hypothetical protein